MNDHLAAQGVRFRDFRWDDIPALVDIHTRTSPDNPGSQEWMEHYEKTYPADNPRRRYIVENAAGKCIGQGLCDRPMFLNAPGVYLMWIMIDPDWRQRGIAQALVPLLEDFGRAQGAEKLWTSCREDRAYSIRFLEQAGFHLYGQRFESVLDLTAFDERRFAGTIERLAAAGFEFTTLVNERAINLQADGLLYEINAETAADIPWPGGARTELTYEQFQQHMDSPNVDPAAILIAKYQGRYAGITSVEFPAGQTPYTEITGVRREYRGQGLALALKLLSFRVMKVHGCAETITQNDTANQPILSLNEKLGYQKRPAYLQWEKALSR